MGVETPFFVFLDTGAQALCALFASKINRTLPVTFFLRFPFQGFI